MNVSEFADRLENTRVLEDLNEAVMNDRLNSVKVFYVDLGILIDIWVGAILATELTEEQYNCFLDNTKKLCTRLVDDIEYLVPNLNITNKQISEMIQNNPDKVFALSPISKLKYITEEIAKNGELFRIKEGAHSRVKLTCNLYPLNISRKKRAELKLFLTNAFAADVELVYYDISKLTNRLNILKHDSIWLYDINAFVENESIKEAFKEEELIGKRLYSFIRVKSADLINTKTDNELRESISLVNLLLQSNTEEFIDLNSKL